MTRILLINGPNLNLLGEREPDIYGRLSLADIEQEVIDHAKARGALVTAVQSNCEGTIIDRIHSARTDTDGLIINPGAYSLSHAIADAIRSTRIPTVEIHISNVFAREEWRQRSAIAPAAVGTLSGFGWYGYIMALNGLLHHLGQPE